MGCGCGKRGKAAASRGGGAKQLRVVGYYADLPDGTQVPNVAGGEPPFMSAIEARVEVNRARGGTIRSVKR